MDFLITITFLGISLFCPLWILTWLVSVVVLGLVLFKERARLTVNAHVVMIILAWNSILGFKARTLPFVHMESRWQAMRQAGALIKQQDEKLKSYLTRSVVRTHFRDYGNPGVLLGLSTLEGYWVVPQRFNLLYETLNHDSHLPVRTVLQTLF
jgi:hypothetical protein